VSLGFAKSVDDAFKKEPLSIKIRVLSGLAFIQTDDLIFSFQFSV
jgi:hypothetical protein